MHVVVDKLVDGFKCMFVLIASLIQNDSFTIDSHVKQGFAMLPNHFKMYMGGVPKEAKRKLWE